MPKLPISGRIAALGGVVVATASALAVAMAAPAVAADSKQTSCTDQVRVRSQPSTSAPVIGSCKPGEKITVDETRGGFAHAVNKEGWISKEYVAATRSDSSSRPSGSRARGDDNDSASTGDTGDDATEGSDDKKSEDSDHDSGGSFLGL